MLVPTNGFISDTHGRMQPALCRLKDSEIPTGMKGIGFVHSTNWRERRGCRGLIVSLVVLTVGVLVAQGLYVPASRADTVAISPQEPDVSAQFAQPSGSLVVITDLATFDPPKTFAEADLRVTGPGGTIELVDFPSGDFAHVAVFDVSIPLPGPYTAVVTWSTDGLDNSPVDSPPAFFVVVPLPQNPQLTPQQEAAAAHISNELWKVAASLAAAAVTAPDIPLVGTGGLAGTGAALTFGVSGGVSAWMAAQWGNVSGDPPDPDYTEIAPSDPVDVGQLVAGGSMTNPSDIAAVNAYLSQLGADAGLTNAYSVSIDRASGAADAGDETWREKQMAAANSDLTALLNLLSQDSSLRAAAVAALQNAGYNPSLTESDITAAQVDAATNGVNAQVASYLHGIGMPDSAIAQLPGEILQLDPTADSGSVLPAEMIQDPAEAASEIASYASQAPPTVTQISPTTGPDSGGTSVHIVGTNLATATDVQFGSDDATAFSCTNTACDATNPGGEDGPLDVTVTTPAGTSDTTSADVFTYVEPPGIIGISPQAGPAAGGTTVTITGSTPGDVDEIDFGTTPGSDVICHVGWCTATAPPGSATVDIIEKGSDGSTTINPADRFTYLTPVHNLLAAGDFEPGDGVPNENGAFQQFDFGSTIGPWHVAAVPNVTDAGGVELVGNNTAQPYSGTQFLAFGELSQGDTSGPAEISQTIPITAGDEYALDFEMAGKAFGDPLIRYLKASIADTTQTYAFDTTGFTTDNQGWASETLTAPVCSGSTATISLAQVDPGTRGPEVDNVSLTDLGPAPECTTAPPTVTAISPTSGPTGGGTQVTITGTDLTGATAVQFGTAAGTNLTCASDSQCSVTSPAGTGTVDITVTTTAGTSTTTAADHYTYTAPPPPLPTVTALSPTSGPAAGGTPVTITGNGLAGVSAINFGSTPGTALACVSDTSCLVTSPPGTDTVDVTVTSPAGTSATSGPTSSPTPGRLPRSRRRPSTSPVL